MTIYELYTKMREDFGDKYVLEELVRSLATDEFTEDIKFIARMNGYDDLIDDEDEEEVQ